MRLESIPQLDNPDLLLRPVELADVDAWYGYLSIPHVLEHTSWNLQSSDDLRAAIAWYNMEDAASPIRFAIVERRTNAFVGTIGFHTVSPINKTAEIAYDLHPDYWGHGIATLCCRAAVRWGLAEYGFVRVQATALDTNAASVRVLEKSGFILEGKLRNFRLVRGVPRDFWLYARTSNDNDN
jgi:ribosomal-protein-alanine N-acetyltransferase